MWLPKCEGNVRKTMLYPVIPSEMDTNIKIVEKIDPLTDSEGTNQNSGNKQIPPDYGR
jgi:hypothetical protein